MVLRVVIDEYLGRFNLGIKADHEVDNIAMAMSLEVDNIAMAMSLEVDNIAMAMSLVASTRGVALLPAYVRNFMPWSVTSRPIVGDSPTIDLVIGYNKANASPMEARECTLKPCGRLVTSAFCC